MAVGVTFLDELISIKPSSAGSWMVVDVSSYVPETATGIIVILGTSDGLSRTVGARPVGSSADRLSTVDANYIRVSEFVVKLDNKKCLEIRMSNVSSTMYAYLVGYTDEYSYFLDDYLDITPDEVGWQDVDLSSHAPKGSTVAWVNFYTTTYVGNAFSFRKKLSEGADTGLFRNILGARDQDMNWCYPVPLDDNYIASIYLQNISSSKAYLAGFSKNIVMFDNKISVNFDTDFTWTSLDLSANIPAGATSVLLLNANKDATGRAIGSRKTGSSVSSSYFNFLIVGARSSSVIDTVCFSGCELDNNRAVEYYSSNSATGLFYLLGYVLGTSTPQIEQHSYRFRKDDGSETTATWLESLNTGATADKDINTRIRMLINNKQYAYGKKLYQLEYKEKTTNKSWRKI